VATLALAAVRDAAGDGARAAGMLLEDLRRAPLEGEALVARAHRVGVDLTPEPSPCERWPAQGSPRERRPSSTSSPRTGRLERLGELTALHPGQVDDRERLGLGVKAHLVLEALAEVR
jgi:hypothetical protein